MSDLQFFPLPVFSHYALLFILNVIILLYYLFTFAAYYNIEYVNVNCDNTVILWIYKEFYTILKNYYDFSFTMIFLLVLVKKISCLYVIVMLWLLRVLPGILINYMPVSQYFLLPVFSHYVLLFIVNVIILLYYYLFTFAVYYNIEYVNMNCDNTVILWILKNSTQY